VTARQRTLFDDAPEEEATSRGPGPMAGPPVAPHPVDDAVRALAGALDPRIRLGTSSWSFPGWTGLVYAPRHGKPEGEQRLARGGLAAYATHPLLRTVSVDRTFHAPISAAEFARYAADVPDGFRFVVKAPAAFTDPVVRQPGSGMAARDNPSFLDASGALAAFVQPALAGLGATAGPLVFQFPPLGRRLVADLPRIIARIAAFVAVLPRGPLYAVEVRDAELACRALAETLADAGAVPCLAVHARMPPVDAQAAAFGLDRPRAGRPLVARWNLHAGRGYEEARGDYFPFNRLVEEDEPSRLALARHAAQTAGAGSDVFITINNKAEGSAPLSVAKLAAAIATGS